VQSLLPGSVVQINVKLGAVVNRGDVLFQLEDEDVLANFEDNEITFHSARAAEIRLAAELAGGNELRFPDDLTAQAPAVVQQERVLFSSRQQALQSRLLVLEDAVNTLERSIVEKQAESRILTSQAQLYAEEVALLEPLVAAGHEPKAPLLAARTRYQQAIGAAELAQLAADARKSDLQGKRREKQSLIANFKAEAAAELVEAKTKAAQYLSRQEALRGKVRHAEIRSPLTGTVSAVHVKTIGAVVQAGTVLVDIVPSEAVLLARAQISPQHVANVRPGQIARLSVSAYDPSRYGVLMGVVQRVAKNTTQLENQMPFYETIIEIPELRLTKSGVLPDITAGMPLTVDILGDKRTVINYIMTPIEKSWNTAFREK
jgi:HlyD family type I secretion membrane fusion protein